jgi:cytochrome c oxidase subunit III
MSEERRDPETARLGMWLFLLSELILFGGLFLLYLTALRRYHQDFHDAAKEMNLFFGGINTAILITSSLFAALSVASMKRGERRRSVWLLAGTIFLGCAFLFNKYLEWSEKIHHGLFPDSPAMMSLPDGRIFFFDLYYVMTGLHGLHVAVGVGLFCGVLYKIHKESVSPGRPVILENCGLYWHLVDIIWIYLFPVFYLIT